MFDWLQNLSDFLVYDQFGLSPKGGLGIALNFFFYDTIKILILLFSIVFLMGIVNTYFPIDKLRNFLQRRKLFGLEYLLASLFGALTPFCSCSSVPLFIGFVQGGIPLGVTFSFLISSPLVNEVALAMFIGLFGWKVTLVYALSGILLGSFGGWLLGRLKLEGWLSEWAQKIIAKHQAGGGYQADERSFGERLPEITGEAWSIVKGVILYVVIGIGIGAAMHGSVPDQFFAQYLGGGQWWTVPLAVILAVPIYANAAAIVPVIQVLVVKGVPLGTSLAFMMATVGLSIPEGTLLKKVMSLKLIALYFGVVSFFIILSGWLFQFIF